ncbi:MAG: hypothetical protein JSW08_03105 [archaeon]|nr:MAG: hypothetical protein JSW08_03105 [archaeon]
MAKSVGGIWKNKKGELEYWNIQLGSLKFVAFNNKFKKQSKEPDLKIFHSKDKEERSGKKDFVPASKFEHSK